MWARIKKWIAINVHGDHVWVWEKTLNVLEKNGTELITADSVHGDWHRVALEYRYRCKECNRPMVTRHYL